MKISYLAIFLFAIAITNSCGERVNTELDEVSMLKFSGEFDNPFVLGLEELKSLPQIEVEGKDRDGEYHKFQGVLFLDLLKQAGMEFGTGLKGANQAQYLLVEAADGYKVVFSLPEIDPEFSGKQIIVAHSRDSIPLSEGVGPFRLVVPEEKLHARWIREVVEVKLIKIK